MDIFDRAQELEQRQREQALKQATGNSRSNKPSLEYCRDCDQAIPEARRKTGGVERCISCQTIFEGEQA